MKIPKTIPQGMRVVTINGEAILLPIAVTTFVRQTAKQRAQSDQLYRRICKQTKRDGEQRS